MPDIKVEPTIPNYPPQGIQAQLDLLYLWNPDVANDLIEQINKALEDLDNSLSMYLTKDEAAATYATQEDLESGLAGKQDSLTTEQLAAVNSGITAEHVTTYDGYAAEISQAQADATKAENAAEVAQQTANLAGQEAAQALTQLAGKQATLTEPQLNAVNSGITADKVSAYDGYQTDLTTLDGDVTDLGSQVTEIQQNINTLNTAVSGKANTADLPQNQAGTSGQVYTKTEDGGEWADVPSGALPDQAGNAGRFLTTDGSQAAWGDGITIVGASDAVTAVRLKTGFYVRNTSATTPYKNSLTMCTTGEARAHANYALAITVNATDPEYNSVVDGVGAIAIVTTDGDPQFSAREDRAIAIGFKAKSNGVDSIQLGMGTNNIDETFQVWDKQLLNKTTGLIPTERLASGGTTGQVLKKTGTGCEWGDLDVYSKEETDQQIQTQIGTIETALAEV